jgi:hypothetical protein
MVFAKMFVPKQLPQVRQPVLSAASLSLPLSLSLSLSMFLISPSLSLYLRPYPLSLAWVPFSRESLAVLFPASLSLAARLLAATHPRAHARTHARAHGHAHGRTHACLHAHTHASRGSRGLCTVLAETPVMDRSDGILRDNAGCYMLGEFACMYQIQPVRPINLLYRGSCRRYGDGRWKNCKKDHTIPINFRDR